MTDKKNINDLNQPLMAHLLELRDRLLRAVLAIVVVFSGLFYFSKELYTLVAKPLIDVMPEGTSMIATDVTSPFLVPFKLSFYAALLVAMPIILHQAWAFMSPGLYRKEKRFAIPLLVSSVLLFYAGVAFAYFVVFPLLFAFFTSIAPEGVAVMTDISRYLDFISTLFIAFGLAFELPIAILLLVWSGLTTVEKLRESRPYVVVGCFLIGMLLTPPDVFSQTLLALPMWLLYEVGIIIAAITGKRNEDDTPSSTE
ncbi:MAG: twin-arginine translocase subunit TatC [Gammaproteobacteria bacterium]|jgi:sec-independent protein translocase protein TatC|nr:twin-arginine translocase subunit TatC [Gammaproteobacteria bacterium]MBQ0773404.1 twin-arginine translocase subunit TatC [Gammaproteobacteria bacterium]|tara:strand:+ start:115732 stop:116496 length:765 start_codon:yes stop_codon:yes gene_type:complete